MIEITQNPISPELVINKVKTDTSGCVATYIGLIRQSSQGKEVLSVEYSDAQGKAASKLQEVADETRKKWQINNITIYHRIGKLKVGDINLTVAIAASHRKEGFAACQFVIDRFKETLPTRKIETYQDGSIKVEGE